MIPMVLFDKSAIEMLNEDEAAVFDALLPTNLCPIYLVEVLADLSKEASTNGRSVEKVVSDMAKKTPVAQSYPNAFHADLCLAELFGQPVEMKFKPARAGGHPVKHNGKIAIVHGESAEAEAFIRWQEEKFQEVEREFASGWREALRNADFTSLALAVRQALSITTSPKSDAEALSMAKSVLSDLSQRFRLLQVAFDLLAIPASYRRSITARWKAAGRPLLKVFAPYTAHCVLVDLFFYICVEKRLISPDRASNRVDMAYLYYTPFAVAFLSHDKLHRRVAPLFLRAQQRFIYGVDLKADLANLSQKLDALPEEERERGLFASSQRSYLPTTMGSSRRW